MDTSSNFIFACTLFSIVISGECSVAVENVAQDHGKLSRSPALSGVHNFSDEESPTALRDLPRSIELKDFAASNDSTSREEPSEFSKPGPYNFAEEKWLFQDVSYANYIREILGRKFLSKFSPKRKNHPVATVFHKPETFEEEKAAAASPQPESIPPSMKTDNGREMFHEEKLSVAVVASHEKVVPTRIDNREGRSERPLSSHVNSTFENQLEEPESPTANVEDSEAETEYYSMSTASASQEVQT
jgi:hypothetical protein